MASIEDVRRKIKEEKKKEKEREREKERELQDRFDADAGDIVAFTIATWQLFIPLVVALFIVGLIMIFLLNLF